MENYFNTEDRKCYICLSNSEPIIYACLCKGSNNGTHRKCLEKWIKIADTNECSICKYKYKYTYKYKPSYDRLKHNFISCKHGVISSNEDVVGYITFYIIITSLIIFSISIFSLDYNIIFLPLYYLIFQIISILFFMNIDNKLLYFTILKLWNIFSSLFIYGFIIFITSVNYNECIINCYHIKHTCTSNCSQFTKYIDNHNQINRGLICQILVNLFLLTIDIFLKIFKSLFKNSIKEYKIENYNRRVSFL